MLAKSLKKPGKKLRLFFSLGNYSFILLEYYKVLKNLNSFLVILIYRYTL